MKVTTRRPIVAGLKRALGSPKIFERVLNLLAMTVLVLAMLAGLGGMYEVAFHADLGSTNAFLLALFKALGGTMLGYIIVHLATRHNDVPTYVKRGETDYGMSGISDEFPAWNPPPPPPPPPMPPYPPVNGDPDLVGPIAAEPKRRARIKNMHGDQD